MLSASFQTQKLKDQPLELYVPVCLYPAHVSWREKKLFSFILRRIKVILSSTTMSESLKKITGASLPNSGSKIYGKQFQTFFWN